jgi:hypothetical protein
VSNALKMGNVGAGRAVGPPYGKSLPAGPTPTGSVDAHAYHDELVQQVNTHWDGPPTGPEHFRKRMAQVKQDRMDRLTQNLGGIGGPAT